MEYFFGMMVDNYVVYFCFFENLWCLQGFVWYVYILIDFGVIVFEGFFYLFFVEVELLDLVFSIVYVFVRVIVSGINGNQFLVQEGGQFFLGFWMVFEVFV